MTNLSFYGLAGASLVAQRHHMCFIIHPCATSAPLWPAWRARWHVTRGIRVEKMTEVHDAEITAWGLFVTFSFFLYPTPITLTKDFQLSLKIQL